MVTFYQPSGLSDNWHRDNRRSSVYHFQRKYLKGKEYGRFRPLETFLQFPHNYLSERAFSRYSMTKGKYGTKLYAKLDLRLRLLPIIPDFKQNSLISHNKKLTNTILFCFVDWLKRQRSLLLFVYKKKKPKVFSHILVTLYWKLTNSWVSVKYFVLEWGITNDIVGKALFSGIFSCCVENCASST